MRVGTSAAATLSLVLAASAACRSGTPSGSDAAARRTAEARAREEREMNPIAESYVKLVLALGQHDPDYVDAYYGPAEWKPAAGADGSPAARRPIPEIHAEAVQLLERLTSVSPGSDEMARLRHAYLIKQLSALRARAQMLTGRKPSFDEESRALYDAVAPTNTEAHFRELRDRLAKILPGEGSLGSRYEAYRSAFVVPSDKLDAVFTAAIRAARERTRAHISLPPDESFRVEYVTGKSWSGYNWYQGGYRSLIQVNTDLPTYIDRAVDLAAHEGYPGHHVYNVLLEKNLVRDRGWQEFSVYPLFSPQSLIAEGSANYGIEVAFPGTERIAFERDVLFPIAGIDPSRAGRYAEVQGIAEGLSYAGNEAARRYLNGQIDAKAAADWLEEYSLMSRPRAEQRVRFIEQYRSYVINYNLGKDLVRRYIESRGGTVKHPEKRWSEFARLLSSPRLPSDLLASPNDPNMVPNSSDL